MVAVSNLDVRVKERGPVQFICDIRMRNLGKGSESDAEFIQLVVLRERGGELLLLGERKQIGSLAAASKLC